MDILRCTVKRTDVNSACERAFSRLCLRYDAFNLLVCYVEKPWKLGISKRNFARVELVSPTFLDGSTRISTQRHRRGFLRPKGMIKDAKKRRLEELGTWRSSTSRFVASNCAMQTSSASNRCTSRPRLRHSRRRNFESSIPDQVVRSLFCEAWRKPIERFERADFFEGTRNVSGSRPLQSPGFQGGVWYSRQPVPDRETPHAETDVTGVASEGRGGSRHTSLKTS